MLRLLSCQVSLTLALDVPIELAAERLVRLLSRSTNDAADERLLGFNYDLTEHVPAWLTMMTLRKI